MLYIRGGMKRDHGLKIALRKQAKPGSSIGVGSCHIAEWHSVVLCIRLGQLGLPSGKLQVVEIA